MSPRISTTVFIFGRIQHDPAKKPALQAALTTHVDDLAVAGSPYFLDGLYKTMCKEFGKITKESLPFSHCGCRYSRTSSGLKVDQSDFASRLKPAPEPSGSDDRKLTPEEITQLRSVIGGLMWLCSTRLDLVADTGVLQYQMLRCATFAWRTKS